MHPFRMPRRWKEAHGDAPVSNTGPTPQPETKEPQLADPGLRDLSLRDYRAIVVRAGKEALDDGITDWAAALAYYLFLSLPPLLLTLGTFGLVAVRTWSTTLWTGSRRWRPPTPYPSSVTASTASSNQSGSIVMIVVGAVLAVGPATGAMTRTHAGPEPRVPPGERASCASARPLWSCSRWPRSRSPRPSACWCSGPSVALDRWAANLESPRAGSGGRRSGRSSSSRCSRCSRSSCVGPNVDHPRWRFVTPSALFTVVAWLAISGLFAVYVSMFGSYNKAWGSLAAVIVMLAWLWLSRWCSCWVPRSTRRPSGP